MDIKRLLEAEGITVDVTETVTNLTSLSKYMAVIFFSNSRDTLWDHGRAVNPAFAVSTTTSAYLDAAKVNLRQYMRAGGGFVGDSQRLRHRVQLALVRRAAGQCQLLRPWCLPERHGRTSSPAIRPRIRRACRERLSRSSDEWYNLVPFPTNVKFLAHGRREPRWRQRTRRTPATATFHPVTWCQYYDGGRAWITTLGHDALATADLSLPTNQPGGATYYPGADAFQKMLVNGIKSAMGLVPFCEAYAFNGFTGDLKGGKAGKDIELKFTLGTNAGPNPVRWAKSAEASCSTGLPFGTMALADINSSKGTEYSAKKMEYKIKWKTDKAWSDTCRQVWVMLDDGTIHTANVALD